MAQQPQSPEPAPRKHSPLLIGFLIGFLPLVAFLLYLILPSSSSSTRAPEANTSDEYADFTFESEFAEQRRFVEIVTVTANGWERNERPLDLRNEDSESLLRVMNAWATESRSISGGRVRAAFVDDSGRAYIDFVELQRQTGGTTSELELVGSIAQTIAANFSNIRSFQVLSNGEPITAFGGHLDFSMPFNVAYFSNP